MFTRPSCGWSWQSTDFVSSIVWKILWKILTSSAFHTGLKALVSYMRAKEKLQPYQKEIGGIEAEMFSYQVIVIKSFRSEDRLKYHIGLRISMPIQSHKSRQLRLQRPMF